MTDFVPGTFAARAVGPATFGASKGGNPQVAVRFKFIGGEYDGKHMTWIAAFSGKAEEITLSALRNCGWKTDDLRDLTMPPDFGGLQDSEVELVLQDDEYEGETRVKIRWVNRGGRFEFKQPLVGGDLAAFAAKMKGAAVASRQNQPPPAASTKTPTKATDLVKQMKSTPKAPPADAGDKPDFDEVPF